jgi:hypothetical protein
LAVITNNGNPCGVLPPELIYFCKNKCVDQRRVSELISEQSEYRITTPFWLIKALTMCKYETQYGLLV